MVTFSGRNLFSERVSHDDSKTDAPHENRNNFSHEHSLVDSGPKRTTAIPINTESDPDYIEARQFYNIPPTMDWEEASYLLRTILSFKHYQQHTFAMNHARMRNFYALPESHRKLLQPVFTAKLEAIDVAIEKNAFIAKRIARIGEEMYLGGVEVRMGGPLVPMQKYVRFPSILIVGIWKRQEAL
jgi:hypothetical protein